jgi:RNA ligase
MYLWELFTPGELMRTMMDGYVREQKHPTAPYRILNYTEKAVFDKHWTPVTLNCRGLIIDNDFKVIARPFPKFFNHSEHDNDVLGNLPKLDLGAEVLVTDKLDGSLGILYQLPDKSYAIATRGSFTSPQALHATEVWREWYGYLDNEVPRGTTLLFEIIYPENRIVCDYEGDDDLFLIGAVDIETGRVLSPKVAAVWMKYPGPTIHYPGPQAKVFGYSTLADALAAEPREGAEGLVVTFTEDGTMVKIKQEDYIILHRLVTGLSKRTVWEALGSGQSAREICLPLPDEFHGWVHEVAAELLEQRDVILSAAAEEHQRISESLASTDLMGREYRAAWAREAVKSEHRAWLFMLLDGKDPSAKIWETLKPEAFQTPFSGEEKDS